MYSFRNNPVFVYLRQIVVYNYCPPDFLQDLVICIEMFVAAVAHYFSFSYRPFVDLAAEPQNCFASFKSMWDFSDVQKDVVEHIKHVGKCE